MPRYDYECTACGVTFEALHSMTEKPTVVCPECGCERTRRVYSSFNMSVRNTSVRQQLVDGQKRSVERKQDLIENYGVENVAPVGGASESSVYQDIKAQGDFVRDKMQAQRELNEKKQKQKHRDWTAKARPRADKRGREMKERKAADEAKKRAISI